MERIDITLDEYCSSPHPEVFHCLVLDALVPTAFCQSMCGIPSGDYSLLAEFTTHSDYQGAARDWFTIPDPTLRQMVASFATAMARWMKQGLSVVSQDEYIRRRLICKECGGRFRCPVCGCIIWLKAALPKEVLKDQYCPLWEPYEDATCSDPSAS